MGIENGIDRKSPMEHNSLAGALENERLENYRIKVEAAMVLARSGKGEARFSNDGVGNARIVADVLLRSASRSVNIYSEKLHCNVFSADILSKLIEQGLAVRLVLDAQDASENQESVLSELKHLVENGSLQVKYVAKGIANHFTQVDNDYVRFELNHTERTALVSFGDPVFGKEISELFEAIWAVAKTQTPSVGSQG